jgi:arginine repressor
VDNEQNEGIDLTSATISKLERLQLIYAPKRDEQLLYIMTHFTGLNYLHITGSSGGMSGPPATISALF